MRQWKRCGVCNLQLSCRLMSPRVSYSPGHRVLLIHSDFATRGHLASALAVEGIPLTLAGRIADVERWPEGEVVICDQELFTSFWLSVGAAHVVVTEGEGPVNCRRVTTVSLHSGAEALLAVLSSLREVAA